MLHDASGAGPDEKLAAIGEILGHIADDARGLAPSPFVPGAMPWGEAGFLAAIEAEDEARAAALIRGALEAGHAARDLAPSLFTAALAHYQDFGHSLIYSVKAVALIERLGPQNAEPLLLALVRSLIYASREDLLPEFRDYRERFAAWGHPAPAPPPFQAEVLRRGSARTAMAAVAAWSASHEPQEIFPVLVEAAAWALLHVDAAALTRTDGKIAGNVGWLDFTHALTFAEAGRQAAAMKVALWPAVLLQLACFIGRNSTWLDPDIDGAAFAVADPRTFIDQSKAGLFDHGRDGFIISVHVLKTLMAAEALAAAMPEHAATLHAAINRFVHAPMKRRHVLRTARQMRAFVAEE